MEKYVLTNKIIVIDGKTLYQIKAVKSFGEVKEGQKGGYVESQLNLCHTGNCWINEYSAVFGRAMVLDNAVIEGSCTIYDRARICDDAKVSGNSVIYGDARIYGEASVHFSRISDEVHVCEEARAYRVTLSGSTVLTGIESVGHSLDYMTFKLPFYFVTVTKTSFTLNLQNFTFDCLDKWIEDDDKYSLKPVIESALNFLLMAELNDEEYLQDVAS